LDKTLPLKIQSPNVMEHWTKRYKRNQFNHSLIRSRLLTPTIQIHLPCSITLERAANRFYDVDNYIFACKGVKDSIASIILNKKRGQDDDNPGITWIYKQVKGKQSMRIEITWDEIST